MKIQDYIAGRAKRDPEFAADYDAGLFIFQSGLLFGELRRKRKMTIPKLAKKSHVSAAIIRAFEKGEAAVTPEEFHRLLDFVDLTPRIDDAPAFQRFRDFRASRQGLISVPPLKKA